MKGIIEIRPNIEISESRIIPMNEGERGLPLEQSEEFNER